MKRIGVITHYYNSRNYGGVLQAYALVQVLSRMGFCAEQICWDGVQHSEKRKKKKGLARAVKKEFWNVYTGLIRKKLQARADAFEAFRQEIPHSSKVYDSTNIQQCANQYDMFVTGSDQVWNMEWYDAAYFLDFAPADKTKFSYAASMPNTELTEQQKARVEEHLKRFDGISVREQETAAYLTELMRKEVAWVLDPTLLLDRDQWEMVCTPRAVQEPYIFCYFLSTEEQHRKLAAEYSKKLGCQLVTLPYLNRVNGQDFRFGDMRLYDVSPGAFISLIKNAEYVVTDSFHAAVFSSIYQKEYFVFGRPEHKNADSRIYGLTELFGTEAHFCDTPEKMKLEYLLQCEPLDYAAPADGFETMKKQSLDYLSRMLDNAKEMIDNHEK